MPPLFSELRSASRRTPEVKLDLSFFSSIQLYSCHTNKSEETSCRTRVVGGGASPSTFYVSCCLLSLEDVWEPSSSNSSRLLLRNYYSSLMKSLKNKVLLTCRNLQEPPGLSPSHRTYLFSSRPVVPRSPRGLVPQQESNRHLV